MPMIVSTTLPMRAAVASLLGRKLIETLSRHWAATHEAEATEVGELPGCELTCDLESVAGENEAGPEKLQGCPDCDDKGEGVNVAGVAYRRREETGELSLAGRQIRQPGVV